MPDIYPSRSVLINLLVSADVDSFFDRDDPADYLAYLFEKGIKGYSEYTDQQLIDECIDREINLEECEDA